MVNIIICGPAGAGKTTLIENLRRSKCRTQLANNTDILDVANEVLKAHGIRSRESYRCDDRNYIDVQRDIILSQCHEERKIHRKEFITDNCILNAMVLLENCVGVDIVEDILEDNDVCECIERYRSSLLVFLWPIHYGNHDGICLPFSKDQWLEFRETYLKLFRRFHIPFLELSSSDMARRIFTVNEAMKGNIPLESSTLQNYDQKKTDAERIVPSYFVFLLQKKTKEDCIEIPTLEISEHCSQQTWTSYPKGETNRFIAKEGHNKLICLKFDIGVRATVVQKMLLGGVYINGCKFSFLGCSSSGLKSRKCFMYEGTATDVQHILESHGDFISIRTVSKRLARIGLLFSGVTHTTIKIEEKNVMEKKDITISGTSFNFTDGCGAIGKTVAEQLTSYVTDVKKGYVPAVFQVRFQGYKGVFALDLNIPEEAVMVRPSMKKFNTQQHPNIGVCDYSKPYTFGHLNKQFIILLSGRGVKEAVFEEKQSEFFEVIQSLLSDSECAIRFLQWQNMFDVAQYISRAGSIDNMPVLEKEKVKQQLKSLQTKVVSKIEKLGILIKESRNIFGVCDQAGVLKYGECFLRLTISGKPKTIHGQVVVCKNPCYLLGDVRVLTAVSEKDNPNVRKLNHLVDCIVFPTRGKRPHCNEIAGSDLDGDRYFVTWDEQLIPKSCVPPYDYPGTEGKGEGTITDEKVISYFSRQNETQKLISRVDKYFNKWADCKGPGSTECERLGQLFSKVIDSSKTGETVEIPIGLIPKDEEEEKNKEPPKFIWMQLYQNAIAFKEKYTANLVGSSIALGPSRPISEDFIFDFVQQTYSSISEYEKFQFIWNYELSKGLTYVETIESLMDEFSRYISFSLFSVDERKQAIDIGIPAKIVLNALNSSRIISEDELNFFQMDSPKNTWQTFVWLEHHRFDWSYLLKALTTNDNTLLVVKMPDDVIIELQIQGKLTMGREQPVSSGSITGLFYSRHFDYKNKYILGKEYVLDLTEDTFQLYRDCKKNLTFLWLNATDRKRVKGHWNKPVCDEVRNALSVDLQRFNKRILDQTRRHPLINKMPFVMIEIYANNDGGEIPYLDIYEANDLLPVAEKIPDESEEDNDFIVNFESDFPNTETDLPATSQEEIYQNLKIIAESGNPHTFRSLLKKWSPKEIPSETGFAFIEMLNNFTLKVVPNLLPEEMKLLLCEHVSILSGLLKAPAHFLSVLSLLSRLDLHDVKLQLLQNTLDQVASTEYLEILDDWQSFVYLNLPSALAFGELLLLSWTAANDQLKNQTDAQASFQDYVRKFAILHLQTLMYEIYEQKIKFEKASDQPVGKIRPEKESCISFLRVDTTAEKDPNAVHFYRTAAIERNASRFKGQYVMISKQKTREVICAGQIESISIAPCNICVKINGRIPAILLHAKESKNIQYWRLDLIGNIVMHQRIVKAFKSIIRGTAVNEIFSTILQSCNIIQAKTEIMDEEVQSTFATISELNSSQNEAVKCALSRKVSIIQGPPGTGKTEVACHIIRHVVEQKTHHGILVVAETNVAVDNLARRLRNHVSVVRVGPVEGVENDLYDVSLEGQVTIIAEKEARKAKIRDQQGNIFNNASLINRVLTAADVILTTCAGAGDTRLDNFKFSFVLVDEATQTLETTLLCSLVHGAEHLVLIGDPKQLGPVVRKCPQEYISPNLPDVSELSETLFHRWFDKNSVPITFLDVQYRMHQAIMKFPSKEFYDSKLIAATSTVHRMPIVFPWPIAETPLCFVEVTGKEKRYGTSYYNADEIEIVERVIDVLLSVDEDAYRENRIATHQIGIITLYHCQVQKIKERMQPDIKVSTVDGFQGQERDVIVVSTVRCNDRASLGFSDDTRRLNVLLTRAKRGLIVIGNRATLTASNIWARWLKTAPDLQIDDIKPVDFMKKKRGGAKEPIRKTPRYNSKDSAKERKV